MAIELDGDRKAQIPIAKFNSIGGVLQAMLVKSEVRNQRRKNPVTGQWEDIPKRGTGVSGIPAVPQKEEVLTYLVHRSHECDVKIPDTKDDYRPIVPGELVRVIVKGKKWANLIEAYKPLGKKQVGDAHTLTVTSAIAVNEGGPIEGTDCTTNEQVIAQRMKGRNISFNVEFVARRNSDASLVAAAEQHYHTLSASAPVVLHDPDDEPF